MINLFIFIALISILMNLSSFFILSIIFNLVSHLYNYLLIIIGLILLGFLGWCFDDN
jgi:hypothetical protein